MSLPQDTNGNNLLRIHHLDFGQDPGDATLVAVWNGTSESDLTLVQIVLLDGGSNAAGLAVIRQGLERYNLLGEGGSCEVPVTVIATNYVPNFYAGLCNLLISGVLGDTITVYDLGQYGTAAGECSLTDFTTWQASFYQEPSQFATYKQNMGVFIDELGESGPDIWKTGQLALNVAPLATGWMKITDFLGTIIDGGIPLRASCGLTVKVLGMNTLDAACNQMVTNANNPIQDRSMGLCLEFQNGSGTFRYYHGGALTTTQEGGVPNPKSSVTEPSNFTVQAQLISGGKTVHVAKLASKGAITATGGTFLSSIGAAVAIVTCGTDNVYTVSESNPLNKPNLPSLSLGASLPVGTVAYLTGETLPNPPTLALTAAIDAPVAGQGRIVVAGSWPPGDMQPLAVGDITVEVWGPQASSFSYTVNYTAPVNAWSASGSNKSYLTPVRFVDTYQGQ